MDHSPEVEGQQPCRADLRDSHHVRPSSILRTQRARGEEPTRFHLVQPRLAKAHRRHVTPAAVEDRDQVSIQLNTHTATRVVYDSSHNQEHVSIISGGGAGHEPAWAGYVGTNLLAASASGPIFASPSTKQVLSAIDAVPSNKGTILCVGNYTGMRQSQGADGSSFVDIDVHRGSLAFRFGLREGQCYQQESMRDHYSW